MASHEDIEDRKLTLGMFFGLSALLLVVAALVYWFLGPAIGAAVAPGLGLRDAALIAFGLAIVIIIAFAIAAGDGLIGELPYMLLGFGGFFIICWLMLAWIF